MHWFVNVRTRMRSYASVMFGEEMGVIGFSVLFGFPVLLYNRYGTYKVKECTIKFVFLVIIFEVKYIWTSITKKAGLAMSFSKVRPVREAL
jgi:hypothetical protein